MFYKSLLCSLLFGVSLSAMEAGGSEGDSGEASGGAGAGFGSSDDSQISIETVELHEELKEAKAKLKGKPLTQKVFTYAMKIYDVMYPDKEEPRAAPPPPRFPTPRGAPRGMPVVRDAPSPVSVGGVPFSPVPVGGVGAYAGAVRPPLVLHRNLFNFESPFQRVDDFIKIIDFLNYAPSRFSTGDRLEVKDRVSVEDRANFFLSVSPYIGREFISNIFYSINKVESQRFKAFTSFIIDLFERKLEGTSYLFYLKVIYGMEDVPLGLKGLF